MVKSLHLTALILTTISLLAGYSAASKRKVLVIFEDIAFSTSYSQYIESIKDLGYEIEEKSATDNTLQLREWDTWKYDKLVILASAITTFGGALDGESILDFIDSGHDLILAVDSKVGDELRTLATDIGVDLEPRGSAVLDVYNHIETNNDLDHSIVISKGLTDNDAILGTKLEDPIIFQGIGSTYAPGNAQVIVALTGEGSQIMSNPTKNFSDAIQKTGKSISLVSAVQTRNDARILVAGSLAMFSNSYLQAKDFTTRTGQKWSRSSNAVFLAEVTEWCFHEKSVLRASNVGHHPPGSPQQPERYRITDLVHFHLDLQEYSRGSWRPYQASDVQLEFVMLDPHVRMFLKHNGKGTFSADFKIPDVYGVFKFLVDYVKPGLTPIQISQQISVRHFQHDEFERFIPAAFPYYASAFSCMAAFLIFSFVFLYHKEGN